MIIAIFAKSREEYEQLEEWARQYGNQREMRFAGRWFRDLVDYNRNANKEEFPICILALEDIENQEVAVKVREWSEWSQFIWIGEDKRFGLSSHRLGTANFIFKPAKAEDIALSLQRCITLLNELDKWKELTHTFQMRESKSGRQDEKKIKKDTQMEMVQHDAQTGLYNEATIHTLVEQHMQKTQKTGFQALLMIDVDHFKAVNDTYGRLCGDKVLSNLAEVLKRQNRATDFAGRIGGDEFMVYLPTVTDEDAVRKKAERLLSEIHRITPEEGAPPITCSIGAALCQGGVMDYYQLYQCADRALHQRKKEGRAGISFYKEK